MRTFIWVLAGSSLVACSAYSTIPADRATASGTVRVTINPSYYSQVFGPLGAQVRAAEGRVRAIDDSSVTMSVDEVARTSDDDQQYHGETVTFPRQAVAAIDRKHLDVVRSLLVTGAFVGGAIFVGTTGLGKGTVGKPKVPGPSQ